MKKILLFILFCVNINYFCFAQSGQKNKVETLYIAYLTKQIGLSVEEAQQFWPVYQTYRADLKKSRQSNVDELDWEEEALTIRKKYRSAFKKILVQDQRVHKVFKAEKNFRAILRSEQARRQHNGVKLKPGKQNF